MRENEKKTIQKSVKKCLNYAFFVERQESFFNTSNNSRMKKVKH